MIQYERMREWIYDFTQNSKYVEDVSDEEVWSYAREYDEIPVFNNIYYYLVIDRAISTYTAMFNINEDKFSFEINRIATYFSFDDRNRWYDIIQQTEEFEQYLEENYAKN